MSGQQIERRKLADITPDKYNANKGTERGRYMLETSLSKYGAGRSVLLDKAGRVIAGNKTVEVAGELGMEEVLIIHSDGKQLIAVQRDDLDLEGDQGARELAYMDNRAGQVGLAWDAERVELDLGIGVDLSSMFTDGELADIMAVQAVDALDLDEEEASTAEDGLTEYICPKCGFTFHA